MPSGLYVITSNQLSINFQFNHISTYGTIITLINQTMVTMIADNNTRIVDSFSY